MTGENKFNCLTHPLSYSPPDLIYDVTPLHCSKKNRPAIVWSRNKKNPSSICDQTFTAIYKCAVMSRSFKLRHPLSPPANLLPFPIAIRRSDSHCILRNQSPGAAVSLLLSSISASYSLDWVIFRVALLLDLRPLRCDFV